MTKPAESLPKTETFGAEPSADPEVPLADLGTGDSESLAGDSGSVGGFSNFSIDLSVCREYLLDCACFARLTAPG